ncbi:MAG: O-antigen ligase family protein [Burkholderiales bacterium]
MKHIVFLAYFLLGIGRNLPYQKIYFFGLGIADCIFCVLTFLLLTNQKAREGLIREARGLRIPIEATVGLSFLAILSMAFNLSIYGANVRDVFEVLRYFYLIVIMIVTAHFCRVTPIAPVLGFIVGVLISGTVAILNPMNPDVLGTPQIFNPNVIGNCLAVAIAFCSFVIIQGYPAMGGIFAVAAAVFAFFTFSKGTWLMTASSLTACQLALASLDGRNTNRIRYGRYVAYSLVVGLLYVTYQNWDLVKSVIEAKMKATEFHASAAEGGSVSARMGLILSAIYMFLINPLFGVGISNFEYVNNLLQEQLGNAYYDDDNPNSAWFYVLGCMGLPAFFLFSRIFYWFLKRIYRLSPGSLKTRFLYTTCIGTTFFIGGNVQLEMLKAYYYWIALGAISVLTSLPTGVHITKRWPHKRCENAIGNPLIVT